MPLLPVLAGDSNLAIQDNGNISTVPEYNSEQKAVAQMHSLGNQRGGGVVHSGSRVHFLAKTLINIFSP